MYGRSVISLLLMLLIGSITTTNLNSPCPDLFHYDATDQPDGWSGTLTLLSDTELNGIWARLIFDKQLKQLTIEDKSYEAVLSDNTREVLIKNREAVLEAFTPKYVKITVKYADNKIPELVGYRLNARTVCSKSNSIHFNGDKSSAEFVSNLLLNKNGNKNAPEFPDCGTIPKPTKHWPWQVSIHTNRNDNEIYLCQGSLISSKHILTTAHCVNYENIELGLSPKQLIVNTKFNGKLPVEKVQIYPGYNRNSLLNDIAIVTLKNPVNIDDNIRPICLTNNKNTDQSSGIVVQDAAQADVNVVEEEECLKKSDLAAVIVDNSICAAYSSANSICIGDSGSGLVAQRKQSKSVWELRGMVTFGAALQNTCDTTTRILLIDIAKYLKWIQSVVVV